MAATEQQFIDSYKWLSAEQQQKAYNAGNAQVKQWIDNYNNTQVTPQNTQTVTPTNDVPTIRNGWINGNWRPDQRWELTPETYNYYSNDTQAAQDRIVSNLYDYYQKTPNLFTNYQNFKNNFSYDARSDQQKKTLDDWRFGYDKSRQLNTKSIWDLTTLYGSGQLTDADLNNLRTFYPDKYNQVMNKINAQNDMNQYSEMLYWPEDTLDTSNVFNQIWNQYLNMLLNSRYWGSIDYFEQYQSEINTPEMREMSDRSADVQAEIDKINSMESSLYKDIEKRYEWTGASKAKIQAIYADEVYDLEVQKSALATELKAITSKYNSRLQEAQTNFSMRVQQHQLEMQERNQYMSELWFAMDLINFETNEEADERAWKNWTRQIDYQYGNIDSLDPTARRKAVDNSVSQILDQYDWMPMQRSKDQMVEDVLKLVDSGMSLGDALTQNIITPIRSKPEYAIRKNQQLWLNSAYNYYIDSEWNLWIAGWETTVGTDNPYRYKIIDLLNWTAISADSSKVITINWQGYRVTQLWWDTATSWIDLAPVKVWDHQEVQAFVWWSVVAAWTDKNWNKFVEVLWDNGYVYRYNHLNDWAELQENQRVEAWDVLWHMWNTWKTMWATGVHLDLAVYDWKRATDKTVSPLDILDQTRIFFSSVSAQWLSLWSTNVAGGANAWEIDFSWLTNEQVLELWAIVTDIHWKTSGWKTTPQIIAAYNAWASLLRQWKTMDYVEDYLRENKVNQILKDETALYNVASSLLTSVYWSQQNAEWSYLDQVEKYLEQWEYWQAYEWVLNQFTSDRSQLLSKDEKNSVKANKEAVIALQDVNDLLDEYLANDWSVWALKSIYMAASKKWPRKFEWWRDFNDIERRLWIAMQKYIFGLSWKTVTDAERLFYEAIFPTIWFTSARKIKDDLSSLITLFENDIDGIYSSNLWKPEYNNLNAWYSNKEGTNFRRRQLWNYYDPVRDR